MSKKSEKPVEGKEPESSWKDVIYNPRTGQFFGRTAKNWGELTRTLPTASFMLLMKCAVYINNQGRFYDRNKLLNYKLKTRKPPRVTNEDRCALKMKKAIVISGIPTS